MKDQFDLRFVIYTFGMEIWHSKISGKQLSIFILETIELFCNLAIFEINFI